MKVSKSTNLFSYNGVVLKTFQNKFIQRIKQFTRIVSKVFGPYKQHHRKYQNSISCFCTPKIGVSNLHPIHDLMLNRKHHVVSTLNAYIIQLH